MKINEILSTLDVGHWPIIDRYILGQYQSESLECRTWRYIYTHQEDISDMTFDGIRSGIAHTGSPSSYRNVISRLSEVIEDAILHYQINHKSNQEYRSYLLAQHYKTQGNIKLFDQTIQQCLTDNLGSTSYDPLALLRRVQYLYERVYSELHDEDKMDCYDELEINSDLVHRYIGDLLKIESVNPHSSYQGKECQSLPSLDTYPLDPLLTDMYQLVKTQSEDAYQSLDRTISCNHEVMPSYLVQMCLIYMINYCYQRIRQGSESYYESLLEHFEFGLRSQYLLSQGLLSERRFVNIAEAKSYYDTDEAMIRYIDSWSQCIHSEDVGPLVLIAHGYRHFGKGRYGSCVEVLQDVTIKRSRYWLQLIRRWLIICSLSTYPDHKMYLKELNAAEKYFNRNRQKISAGLYRASLNLVRLLRMLHKQVDAKLIEAEMKSMNALVMRRWLTQQIRKGHAHH